MPRCADIIKFKLISSHEKILFIKNKWPDELIGKNSVIPWTAAVINICNKVTIMRNGKIIETCNAKNEDVKSLASKMLGKKLPEIEKLPNLWSLND